MSRGSGNFEFQFSGEQWQSVEDWFRRMGSRWVWVVLGVLMLSIFSRAFVLVGSGKRAVIFNRISGTQKGQLGEGLHFILPWIQVPVIYDVRQQPYTMSAATSESNPQRGSADDALDALTADGLPVKLDVTLQFQLDPEKVSELHQEIGRDYVQKIVRPQARADIRMVVAQYTVVEVYGRGRTQLIDDITSRLKTNFARYHLLLNEVLLRDVQFSPEFQNTIERKQIAQQEVERMKFVLEQADKERQRKIIDAEGEAESIRLKAAALAKNPQLVEYEYVQSLPDNVRTIVTDGRTIINLGEALSPAAVASVTE